MIMNEQQYYIALSNRRKILEAEATSLPGYVHPQAESAMKASIKLQLADLEREIAQYEESRRGKDE